jgi:N,N'-diacetyllegionaminate synthase
LEPDEFKAMVRAIRNIEKAMGNGVKKPSSSEKKNIPIARKSIIAARLIKKGEVFTGNNITTKRPGNGISPMRWDKVIGAIASKDFMPDELIKI